MNNNLENQEENFLYGRAESEEEIPIENPNVDNNLSTEQINSEEKDKERKEKRYFTAFKLIIGCLVFLGIIYIIDTITVIAFGKSSETTNSIMEIIKTLLFTLSGYLFARKENGD